MVARDLTDPVSRQRRLGLKPSDPILSVRITERDLARRALEAVMIASPPADQSKPVQLTPKPRRSVDDVLRLRRDFTPFDALDHLHESRVG